MIKMTSDNLDVVLEVNRKLQMVLEDTLLKNMMQQDNIKMLGEEIDRQVGFLLICRWLIRLRVLAQLLSLQA